MYNCSLSFYYLIVIAFAFSEARVKKIEIFMHAIPLLFSFGSTIAGIFLTLYNNAGLWCWISALPADCENGNDQTGGTGPCERGQYAWIYRWAIYYGPVWFCVFTITLNMTIVSYLVWAKERASKKFKFGHSNKSQGGTAAGYGGDHSDRDRAESKANAGKLARFFAKKKSNSLPKEKERPGLASQVFWQAFYYVLAFYITWIFPTVLRFLQTIGQPVPAWIVVAMAILLPLQGKKFIECALSFPPHTHRLRSQFSMEQGFSIF